MNYPSTGLARPSMKILLVIDNLGSGGAQKQMTLLATGLQKRGHDVTLFLYYPKNNFYEPILKKEGIRIVSTEKKSRFDLGPIKGLRRELRDGRYDTTVAFMPTPGLYLLAARGLANRPPVLVSHRIAYISDRISLLNRATLSVYAIATAIVANSHRGAQQIKAALPFLAHKLCVIPNGVEFDKFMPAQPPPGAAQASLLFIGRLCSQKNIHRLLEALTLIRARGGVLPRVLWAGRVEAGAVGVAYARMVEQRVAELNLSASWVPLGERVNIPALLADSDALILPSVYEGTPNAVCEALAAGRPVLAGRVGDIERLIADGSTGLLFDPLNPSDIADKIQQFLQTDTRTRAEMSAAARLHAERTLSTDVYIDNWEKALQQAEAS